MPFAYVMESLQSGYAAKRPNWAGYVEKTVTDETAGAYTLTFHKRDKSTTIYTYDGTSFSVVTPLSLDIDLLTAMLASDWVSGKASDFAAAVDGQGNW